MSRNSSRLTPNASQPEHSSHGESPLTPNSSHTEDSLPLTPHASRSVAVIGAGYWGKNLVRNFYELGALKTVSDPNPDSLERTGKAYPGLILEKDFNAVLEDKDIQAVVLASPAVLHFSQAKLALEASRHVFVEKPLSLTYPEGEDLVKLAQKMNKTLFVGHILQYHPAVVRLKELVNEGRIGRLQYIYSRRLSLGKIRREENILWSFAPHDISVILSLTGEDPSFVDSVGSNFLHARIADVTMTNLKFPSGIGAHIFVSWLNPFKEQRLVVVGSNGMFVFDDTQPVTQKLVHFPHVINWQDGIPVPQKADQLAIDLTDKWEEPLKAECRAYLSAIENSHKPITSGEEGLRVLKILELSQRSIETKEYSFHAVSSPQRVMPEGRDISFSAGSAEKEVCVSPCEFVAKNEKENRVRPSSSVPKKENEVRVRPRGSVAEEEKEDRFHLRSSVPKENRIFFAHETAIIDDGCEIGAGTKIWHFSHVLSGSKIGENCNIGQNVVIGPDVTIGKQCKIQNNVSVYKGVTLEDGVFCGPSMVFTNIYNPRAEIVKMDQVRPTLVKHGATLGANSTIVCGHTIGNYAFIGAGAVITKDVPDHALVVGNPSKQIGWACVCGERLSDDFKCSVCHKKFKKTNEGLRLL